MDNIFFQLESVERSINVLQEEDREGSLADFDLAALWSYLSMHHALLSHERLYGGKNPEYNGLAKETGILNFFTRSQLSTGIVIKLELYIPLRDIGLMKMKILDERSLCSLGLGGLSPLDILSLSICLLL